MTFTDKDTIDLVYFYSLHVPDDLTNILRR